MDLARGTYSSVHVLVGARLAPSDSVTIQGNQIKDDYQHFPAHPTITAPV